MIVLPTNWAINFFVIPKVEAQQCCKPFPMGEGLQCCRSSGGKVCKVADLPGGRSAKGKVCNTTTGLPAALYIYVSMQTKTGELV